VVHIFGQAADMDPILALARQHGLKGIEDAAQAPGIRYKGRPVGAIGDIGGFSLNYHKHIHTGEGGVIVTNDDSLADRCRLIRNHGENAVEEWGIGDLTNMVGANYRLTELQAAIGLAQLDRLPDLIRHRQMLGELVATALQGCEVVQPAHVPSDRTHSYYVYPFRYTASGTGVRREAFVAAVNAELPPPANVDDVGMSAGYLRPLYLNPVFQKRIAIGSKGFPFDLLPPGDDRYRPGICPTAERVQDEEMILSFLVRDPLDASDVNDLVSAIEKVAGQISALRESE
jgi:dTDP-4-amino-4,6-dideoxygalactose transaminase